MDNPTKKLTVSCLCKGFLASLTPMAGGWLCKVNNGFTEASWLSYETRERALEEIMEFYQTA